MKRIFVGKEDCWRETGLRDGIRNRSCSLYIPNVHDKRQIAITLHREEIHHPAVKRFVENIIFCLVTCFRFHFTFIDCVRHAVEGKSTKEAVCSLAQLQSYLSHAERMCGAVHRRASKP